MSRADITFAEVTESVRTYQELIEVDTVSHVFKNVSFNDVGCTLCHESHKSLECPTLHSIIEMEFLVQEIPMILVLIHAHVHQHVNMVHGDHVIMTGLVLLLDHPEDMIEVTHLDMIIVVVKIITISHMRGMVIIEIGTPALVTVIGDTITPMVSPQVDKIIITKASLPRIKISKVKTDTRVVIGNTTQIYIIIRVMDGTKTTSMVEKVRIDDHSNHLITTNPINQTNVNNNQIVATTAIKAIPTITNLLLCLHCLVL